MPAGRPRKFSSPEQLEELIQEYFDSITISIPRTKQNTNPDKDVDDDFKEPILNNLGEQIIDTEWASIPSILGLCEYLGIHRKTLLEWEEMQEFCNTIKEGKQRIEKYNAEQLYRKEQVTGIIFNLKNNFNWVDKQEIDQKTTLNVVGEVLNDIGITRPDLTNGGKGSN